MTEKTTIGKCDLYHGDALSILPGLGLSADLCVTDAPYKTPSGGVKTPGRMKGGFLADYNGRGPAVPMNCSVTWKQVMKICHGALAADADAYFMANDKHQFECQKEAIAAGFRFHNMLVWDKVSATANRWYMKNLEFIVYVWKGHARMIRTPASKQYIRMPQVDESDHPTEKPVALMMHYIANSTDPGGLVIDPFMGSGTTGVAAARLGRRFVGIELERKYFDIACQRIAAAREQREIFTGGVAVDSQTDMFGGDE